MCGIAGYFSPNNQFGLTKLKIMTDALAHRGPDGEGHFDGGICALGHRRLSIIDLNDRASQPMISANGRYVIAFNGEVYNFQDLKKQLPNPLKTTSDTEVILELFAIKGIRVLDELEGMFAIAIFDRDEEALYLCRDRFGIKPLVYYYNGKDLVFASELKAIHKLGLANALNMEALRDYLFLEFIPAPNTIYQSIYKLTKGHCIKITKDNFTINKWYTLTDHLYPKQLKFINESDALEQLDHLLQKSIQYHLISDVPVGGFLSGGTDSSLLAAKISQIGGYNPKFFTVGFDVPAYDETPAAIAIVQNLGLEHSLLHSTENEALAQAECIVEYYDEPFAAPSTLPSLLLCKQVAKEVKVALAGDGGDELFMGYGHYLWFSRLQKLQGLGRLLIPFLWGARGRRASRLLSVGGTKGAAWLHVWSQEQYMFTEIEISKLMNQKWQHTTTLPVWQKIEALDVPQLTKVSLYDMEYYLADNLFYKMDIASMSSGLEVRVPYIFTPLIAFALSLPVNYKIRDGVQKYLMKKLLAQSIPQELVYKKKWGFPAPIEKWLLSALKPLVENYLNVYFIKKQGLFNEKEVQSLVARFYSGAYYEHKRVWALIVLQMWLKKYSV